MFNIEIHRQCTHDWFSCVIVVSILCGRPPPLWGYRNGRETGKNDKVRPSVRPRAVHFRYRGGCNWIGHKSSVRHSRFFKPPARTHTCLKDLFYLFIQNYISSTIFPQQIKCISKIRDGRGCAMSWRCIGGPRERVSQVFRTFSHQIQSSRNEYRWLRKCYSQPEEACNYTPFWIDQDWREKRLWRDSAAIYTGRPPAIVKHPRPTTKTLSPLLFSYFFPFYSLASSQFSRLFDTGHSFQRGPIRMKGLSCRSANSQQPQQSSRFSSFRCLAVPVPRRIRKVGTIK